MAISFTPCLKKKFKTDKYGIINIRITNNRKSTYISLKEKLHERFWNENSHELSVCSQTKVDFLLDSVS